MTTFDDKEKAAENKYAHDKEVEFLIHARYHKLLGVWASEKLGLEAHDAEQYTKTLITTDFGTHDNEALFVKIKQDFTNKSVTITDHDLREQLHNLFQTAKEQMA